MIIFIVYFDSFLSVMAEVILNQNKFIEFSLFRIKHGLLCEI